MRAGFSTLTFPLESDLSRTSYSGPSWIERDLTSRGALPLREVGAPFTVNRYERRSLIFNDGERVGLDCRYRCFLRPRQILGLPVMIE